MFHIQVALSSDIEGKRWVPNDNKNSYQKLMHQINKTLNTAVKTFHRPNKYELYLKLNKRKETRLSTLT